jgi:hypothetical protein
MEMSNKVKELLTRDFLEDWLTTATYGSFWCECDINSDTPKEVINKAREKYKYREDIWVDILLNGGALSVIDLQEYDEDADEAIHKLTLADITVKLPMFAFLYPTYWSAILDKTMDLYDADALLQFLLFDSIVYA